MRKRTRYSLAPDPRAARRARRRPHPAPAGAPRGRPPAARVRRHRLPQPQAPAHRHPLRPLPGRPQPRVPALRRRHRHRLRARPRRRRLRPPAPRRPHRPQRPGRLLRGLRGPLRRRPPRPLPALHRHRRGDLRRPHHLHHPHRRRAASGRQHPHRSPDATSPNAAAPANAAAAPTRLLRVTQLGYDTLAASNLPTPEQIHSILDRFRAGASPFSGSSLLEARYRDVPLLASAWAIGHIGLPFSQDGHITAFGLQLPLPDDTTFVASLRYTGALRLRIDEILPTEDEAARSATALSSLLDLFRSFQRLQLSARGSATSSDPKDAALRQLLDSLKIQQQKNRAVLTATLPLDLLKQITAAPATTP